MPPLGARRQTRRQLHRRRRRHGDRRRAQGLSAVYAEVRCYPKSTLALYASSRAEHLHLACSRRSLRGNKLGDEGWTALFKALCENKGDKIESWDLSGEGVGPETAKALAEYISVSPALKSVKCARLPGQCVKPR